MKLRILVLRLKLLKTVNTDASKLRGFFATEYNEKILFHQHRAGSFIYKYPLVQYKIINQIPMIVALQEGINDVTSLFGELKAIRLGNKKYEIVEKSLEVKNCVIHGTDHDSFVAYEFITSWFALNQRNFKTYIKLKAKYRQDEFLSRILIGNILSLSKSLGFRVKTKLRCVLNVSPSKSLLKGDKKLLTFKGVFEVNFILPNFIGLGKSVSRGFGTIKQVSLEYAARYKSPRSIYR